MNTRWMFVCLLLIAACTARADLPPVKDRLRMPAIVKAETPAHWLRLHRLSERSPHALLEVLEQYARACESGEIPLVQIGAPHPLAVDRAYALRRLGDVGGEEVIPALERFITRRLEDGTLPACIDVILTQLTIERIRARQAGRSAYIAEMVRWLRGEFIPTRHPATIPRPGELERLSDMATDQLEGTLRIREALRALGVLRAREAIPVLLDKEQWGRFFDLPEAINYLQADALAQMGDKRVLDTLGWCLRNWDDRVPPLEPGQVDPAWAYWQMRTQGMNLEQTVYALVGARAGNDVDRGVVKILTVIGPPAVPFLLKALQQPPGPNVEGALCATIEALGSIRATEALEPLRQLLRNTPLRSVRGAIADALGKIGDPVVIPDLVALLADKDRLIRNDAVRALGKINEPEAIPPLLKVLREHPDEVTRSVAAEMLGFTGRRWLIPILEYQMIVEQSEGVQDYLRWALAILRECR